MSYGSYGIYKSEFLLPQKRAYARPTSFGFPMVDIKNTSDTHLKNALEYILRNDKTENGELIDSYYCTPEYAEIQFEQVRSKEVIKKGNNIAWHLFQSFSPDDETPEQALEIGKELMRRYYPNYQYVIATHTDRDHIHNHIILNSVDFKTFHKLNFNKGILTQIQAVSNDICIENNLSVIDKDGTLNQRRNLRKSAFLKIDEYFKAIKKEYPQELLPAEELSLSDEEIKNYNKIILGSLENIKQDINTSLEDYIENNSAEISEKTGLSKDEFIGFLKSNIDYAFKKFEEVHKKKKVPAKPEALNKNLKELIFTAVEKTYNNIPKIFNHKYRLKKNIDNAVQQAADYDDFIRLMQESGYEIKSGGRKGLAFKDEDMMRFMYAKSISLEYSESMLKYRIKNRKEPPKAVKKRTVYDDKIKSRSKRKRLKAKIDASIKKASSYEEFIEDMKRKNFEIKQGMHLAFKDLDLAADDGKEQRFLRAKSLGPHYTEDAIKFRITHKEQYKKMTDNKINKVMTVSYCEDVNLISWKRGENGQITTNSRNWIVDNLLGNYSYNFRDYYNGKFDLANIEIYGMFLEQYDKRKEIISSNEKKIADINKTMNDIQKHIKAINGYWKLKPQLEKFRNVDPR